MLKMSEKSEYNRGKRSSKEYFGKFRSFGRDSQGRIIGNKHSGSREVIGRLPNHRQSGFGAGWTAGQKELMAKKPVRKVRRTSNGGMMGFKMPKFRF